MSKNETEYVLDTSSLWAIYQNKSDKGCIKKIQKAVSSGGIICHHSSKASIVGMSKSVKEFFNSHFDPDAISHNPSVEVIQKARLYQEAEGAQRLSDDDLFAAALASEMKCKLVVGGQSKNAELLRKLGSDAGIDTLDFVEFLELIDA